MRFRFIILLGTLIVLVTWLAWHFRTTRVAAEPAGSSHSYSDTQSDPLALADARQPSRGGSTTVYAHNLMLRKGPDFRIYVRWLLGQMVRTRREVNPSFDDPESFFLNVQTGVIRANIGDLSNFLNAGGVANSPLRNIVLSGDGDQIKLRGTLHKLISLPVELRGAIGVAADNRIQLRVTKLSALKIPLKGLFGGLHITVADLFHPENLPGIEISGNDVFFDTHKLLPPPHIRGQLTSIRVVNPDLEEIYGNASDAVTRVQQWRNFLQLRHGTLDFGKLTMHDVDLIMIDLSNDAWFDLDLNHYQDQLVNGFTRMTPQNGLQIFMPDLDEVRQNKKSDHMNMDWLKNRDTAPPPEVRSR